MFWSVFYEQCKKKGTTPAKVVKELKIATGSITKWKSGTTPNTEALIKISDYFEVSVDYLLGKEGQKEKPLAQSEGLTEQEQILLDSFQKTTEQGRMKIIQTVMNVCEEIEKKNTAQNTKHSG